MRYPAFVSGLLALSSSLTAQCILELEPLGTSGANDSDAAAELAFSGAQTFGEIGVAADADYYRFNPAVASDVRILTGPGYPGAQAGDTTITVYSWIGGVATQIAFNDDAAGRAFYSELALPGLAPLTGVGDYYTVAVRRFAGLLTGTYALDLTITPGSSTLPGVASVENDDPRQVGGVANVTLFGSAGNSGDLAVGGAGVAYTSLTADYDFFQFVVAAPGNIRLETSAGAAPTATDTVIHLVDASLAQLAFDDDGGAGLYSLLNYTIATPGVYYAAVAGWGAASGVGGYSLAITSPVATTSATWTALPGGCPGVAGTPLLDTITTTVGGTLKPELPFIGTTFWVQLSSVSPFAAYLRLVGLNALPLPLDLSAVGLGPVGCLLEISPLLQELAIADVTGTDDWCFPLPDNTGLLGFALEYQAAVLEGPGLSFIMSNRGTAVIGNGY
jgi:hypothetical protein